MVNGDFRKGAKGGHETARPMGYNSSMDKTELTAILATLLCDQGEVVKPKPYLPHIEQCVNAAEAIINEVRSRVPPTEMIAP